MAFFFLLCTSIFAMAQESEPMFGSEIDTADYRILVIGDALGGGLGAGLIRTVESEQGFDVTNRFKEESGIARPEVHDWGVALPKLLEGSGFDAVVVLLGSNDRQSIRLEEQRLLFETPEWAEAYKMRTDRILDALLAGGVKVYWVSIPPMADPDYDAAMRQISALQQERVEAKGARFVDIRPAFSNPDGSYTDMGPGDDGQIRRLRSRDGITFYKQGNNRLGALVLAAIKQGMASGQQVAGTESDGVTHLELAPDVPLFGQSAADGTPMTIRPKDIEIADLINQTAGNLPPASPSDRLAGPRSLAVAGSSAEKLFSLGQMPPPPAGRADDFSYAPAQ